MTTIRTGVFQKKCGESILKCVLSCEFSCITDEHVQTCFVDFAQFNSQKPTTQAFIQICKTLCSSVNQKHEHGLCAEFVAMDIIRDAFYQLASRKCHRTRSKIPVKSKSVVSESTNVGSDFSRATFALKHLNHT